jgi:hypothetical protein
MRVPVGPREDPEFSYGTACQVPRIACVATDLGHDGPLARREWSRAVGGVSSGVTAATSSPGPSCVVATWRPLTGLRDAPERSGSTMSRQSRIRGPKPPRLGTLRLACEPSQRTGGVRSCHGGAPARHGELGHRRSRPSTDPTTDARRTLMRPSRPRGGRSGVGRPPPPPHHGPTCACRGSASAGTGRPGRPRHERRSGARRRRVAAASSGRGSGPSGRPTRTRRAGVGGRRCRHG